MGGIFEDDDDLVVETFYNSSGDYLRRIVSLIDQIRATKHIEEVEIAELLRLVGN